MRLQKALHSFLNQKPHRRQTPKAAVLAPALQPETTAQALSKATELLRQYKLILDQEPMGLVITQDGRIITANYFMRVFLNRSKESLLNKKLWYVFPVKKEMRDIMALAQKAINQQIPSWQTKAYLTSFTRTIRPYRVKTVLLNDKIKEPLVCWVFQDISTQEEKTKLEKYYQTVFKVLELLHGFIDRGNEEDLLASILKEIVAVYGLDVGFLMAYQDKRLDILYAVDTKKSFPKWLRKIAWDDPHAKQSAVYKAVTCKRAFGYTSTSAVPYYRQYFKQHKHPPTFSTYAFPLIINKKVERVISLYSRTTDFFSEELLLKLYQLFMEICTYIAEIRAHHKNQQALQAYEEQLKAQIAQLEENKRTMQRQAEETDTLVGDLILARDAAESANKAKTDFLANVSHELRTPLNAILGFSEAITAETFGPIQNEQYKKYIGYITASGRHLLSLINDILDLSGLEVGKHKLIEKNVRLAPLLQEIIVLVSRYPGGESRRITLHIDNPNLALKADERSLRQIFLNILSNAIKFTKENGRIQIIVKQRPNGALRINFKDNGIGVPKEKMTQLFQPFSQVENVMTRTHTGTGLGLVLVKKMIEMHQGTVTMQSKFGRGTNIIVEFPAERVLQ